MSCPWKPGYGSVKVNENGTIRYTVYGFLVVLYSNFVPKTHHFWNIQLVSIQWPWNPGYGSLKVIGTNKDQSAAYDFLLTFYCSHEPISYHFQDKQLFQSKITNFSHPMYFRPPLKGFPLELGIGAGGQKLEWWGYWAEKEV